MSNINFHAVSPNRTVTLPETNIFAPEIRPGPKRKRSYSNHPGRVDASISLMFISNFLSQHSHGPWSFFPGKVAVFVSGNMMRHAGLCMDVSKNSGTPKWMVYNGKPYQNG